MVPVLEGTLFKGVVKISELVRDHAAAARLGLSKSVTADAFSISNLGKYGAEVLPIINPTEACILGDGQTTQAVVEHRGGVQIRDVMSLILSADHRTADGAYVTQFLLALGDTISTFKMFSNQAGTPMR